MLIILGSVGCCAAVIATTFALAEVLSSPTLVSSKRWSWVLALLALSAFAAVAWYVSQTRADHAPVNLFEETESPVSRVEIELFIEEVDSYRQASANSGH